MASFFLALEYLDEGYEGFVVVEGSQARRQTVRSMTVPVPGNLELRNGLIEAAVLVPESEHFRFGQDYSFTSPSAAATVILGRYANRRREWTDTQGRQLRAIPEAAVANRSE